MFFRSALTKKFVETDWKQVRRDRLFDRERARFAETQEHMQAFDEAREKHAQLRQTETQLRAQLDEISDAMLRARAEMEAHGDGRNPAPVPSGATTEQKASGVRHKTMYPCPTADCRGVVVSQRCGVCNVHYCSACRTPKPLGDTGHVCDPSLVATVTLIQSDCRNCPKCGVAIYRTEGCSQMFCVACKTPFDWRTGSVIDGPIHNPHYFEYLRNAGLNEAQIDAYNHACNDDPVNYYNVYRHIDWMSRDLNIPMMSILRNVRHLESELVGDIRRRADPNDAADHKLRAKYLANQISRDDFVKTLYEREKRVSKAREILPIYETLINVIKDQFRAYIQIATDRNLDHDIKRQRAVAAAQNVITTSIQMAHVANKALAELQTIWPGVVHGLGPFLEVKRRPVTEDEFKRWASVDYKYRESICD